MGCFVLFELHDAGNWIGSMAEGFIELRELRENNIDLPSIHVALRVDRYRRNRPYEVNSHLDHRLFFGTTKNAIEDGIDVGQLAVVVEGAS